VAGSDGRRHRKAKITTDVRRVAAKGVTKHHGFACDARQLRPKLRKLADTLTRVACDLIPITDGVVSWALTLLAVHQDDPLVERGR